jgi:D-alanyl-D-alanine carboxypeptidase (penicillin-binding protein 5/6)
MSKRQAIAISTFFVLFMLGFCRLTAAIEINVNARSAMLVDMTNGKVLYEQNADVLIPPASITKVLTLYLVFEAIRDGRLHLWDNVKVSSRAAKTGGSRMGLRTGDIVPVGELIKGMAVVSGNDACVAIAEHMNGSVEAFVRQMNIKARQLGMNDSTFQTPNGLPAKGQFTTARDIAKLSTAYLRRYPESLNIHSMQSYTYRTSTHRNANRLLGTCQGVDGLKTGFVCASGYNLAATAIRGDHRLIAVVLGAPSAGIRARETARLLEMGYDSLSTGTVLVRALDDSDLSCPVPARSSRTVRKSSGKGRKSTRTTVAEAPGSVSRKGKGARTTVGSDSAASKPSRSGGGKNLTAQKGTTSKTVSEASPAGQNAGKPQKAAAARGASAGKAQVAARGSEAARSSGEARPAKVKSQKGASPDTTAQSSKASLPSESPRKSISTPKPSPKTVAITKPKG